MLYSNLETSPLEKPPPSWKFIYSIGLQCSNKRQWESSHHPGFQYQHNSSIVIFLFHKTIWELFTLLQYSLLYSKNVKKSQKSTHPSVQCTLGWIDFWLFFTFLTKVPLRFVTYLPKVPRIAKKILFDPVTASSLVTTFWVMHYTYKSPQFFIHNMGFMAIKRHRILHRFQKYKLVLVTKCT
jgi:hypothetical protein